MLMFLCVFLRFENALELEVDKSLQIGCDELINHEHGGHNHSYHGRHGHKGKGQAITTFEVGRQPVNNHTDEDEYEYGAVFPHHIGDDVELPSTADLLHHVLGCVPCVLVGRGGIEIGA